MSSCETPRHCTNAIPRSSEPYHGSSLPHFLEFGGLAGASSLGVRGGRARALIGRDVQLPRTLLRPLGWSGSAQYSYQAGLPTDPPIILAVQHPRPHAAPSPPRPPPPLPLPPSSCSRFDQSSSCPFPLRFLFRR